MPVHINVSGTWQECAAVHINVGGTWQQTANSHINVGGVWEGAGALVAMRAAGQTNYNAGTYCYAGISFRTTGLEYDYEASAGGIQNSIPWLLSGVNSDYWVQWTRTGGTESVWNSINPGTSRLQMSTHRHYRNRTGFNGTETIIGYFKIYDAASGGNLLLQSATRTWSSQRYVDPCPLCCFAPGTMVTMARGIEVPIERIQSGDYIETPTGPQEVGEVLIREKRAMYRIQFEDGRWFDVSDEHPLQVEGKGPAAVNPEYEYKNLGVPAKLEVNDLVAGIDRPHSVTSIQAIPYNGVVYTLSNSPFYANGILVY